MGEAPEQIWATYDDAFGVNWNEGQFTTIEQPKIGRYVEYIRADLPRPDLPEGVGELVKLLNALVHPHPCLHCGGPVLIVNTKGQLSCVSCGGDNPIDERGVALSRAADTLEALAADNAAKDAQVARLSEGLGLIETEISSEETYNPTIAEIIRIALQEDDQ